MHVELVGLRPLQPTLRTVLVYTMSLPTAARGQILEHFAKCDQIGTDGDLVTAVRAAW